jgi:hypothetical protein
VTAAVLALARREIGLLSSLLLMGGALWLSALTANTTASTRRP